jgi:predicted RNA binding protein YcfA (HicA-like mRNA interferase family)
MANCQKLLQKAQNGPAGLRFVEACDLAECYGFQLERVKGSHHIFSHPELRRNVNLQPDENGKAKKYQVKQILDAIEELEGNGG